MNKETIKFEYGVWYDISLYFKYIDQLDWALMQFEEKDSDFYPLPVVCEYIKNNDGQWIHKSLSEEDIKYINEKCKPVAFMLWKPFKDSYVFNEVCDKYEDCNETNKSEGCTETNKSLKDEYNVYGSKIEDVKRIKELEGKCAKLTTMVGQLTYELFEEKLDDIVKEKEK